MKNMATHTMIPPAAAPTAMPTIAPVERPGLELEELDVEEPPLPPLLPLLPLELPVGAFTTVVENEVEPVESVFVTTTTLLEFVASIVETDVVASVEYSPLLKLRQKSAASEKTSVTWCWQQAAT